MNSANDRESMIKFGSYDPDGFEDSNRIARLNTTTLDSWTVESEQVRLTLSSSPVTMINQKVMVEPAFPFIYVPRVMFDQYLVSFGVFLTLKGIPYTVGDDYIMFTESCD